jgi:hypothetical protein
MEITLVTRVRPQSDDPAMHGQEGSMVYTDASLSPARYQWEDNSAPSKSSNCGPACVTKIAQFYKDTWFGIEATRRLAAAPEVPTSAAQQCTMLIKRGVPASVRSVPSLSELHGLVDLGRRPSIIGVVMKRVPPNISDHSFPDMHALCVMSGGTRDGVRGFWINDPNFSPPGGIRPDPDKGRKWYPDWVLQTAMDFPIKVLMPNEPKGIMERGRGRIAGPNCNIRTSMSMATSANIYARSNADGNTYRTSDGARLWSNQSQYVFLGFDTSGKWARVRTASGLPLFIARIVFVVTREP